MKVLLADDSRTIRLILRNLLADLGIRDITQVVDGREALAATEEKQFDLILTDIHMPNLDGLSFLKAIRIRPASKHRKTPVIVISSDPDYRQIERARAWGACGYIKKPFNRDGLVAALMAARQSCRGSASRLAAPVSAPREQAQVQAPSAMPKSAKADTVRFRLPRPPQQNAQRRSDSTANANRLTAAQRLGL